MPINIPILLTWLRIILIPLLVALFYLPESLMHPVGRDLTATIVFVVAAWTDWLDGYLARRWNETSAFGAFLDPVADKLMVAAALIILVYLDRIGALIDRRLSTDGFRRALNLMLIASGLALAGRSLL